MSYFLVIVPSSTKLVSVFGGPNDSYIGGLFPNAISSVTPMLAFIG
jgi:hypothetical protein